MEKLIIVLLLAPFLAIGQSVKGTFLPAEDFTYAFLYQATPQGANYIDRGKIDGSGQFEIALDSSVSAGIYKIVYATPPEEHNFDFIYDGKEDVSLIFEESKGVEFTSSDENKLWTSYLKSMAMVNQTISNYYSKSQEDKAGFQSIFQVLEDTQKAYEESAEGKLVAAFIAANRPYMPTEYENLSTYSKHLKSHYLKQIDFSNYLLQSSSFLVDRVTTYVFDIVDTPTDAIYKNHVDDVAAAIGNKNINVKASLLYTIWQRFTQENNHQLANYVTDTYLMDIAVQTENKVLAETLTAYKNTSLGTKAPNFEIKKETETTSLHKLEGSEYYLLVFWSSGCSHCLNELPMVKTLMADKSEFKVITFGLENDVKDWTDEIEKYPDFINVIGLGKWEHPIVKTYGLAATPTYFLLDKDKMIIAKPYEYKDIELAIKGL